jgi:hypothetical protein
MALLLQALKPLQQLLYSSTCHKPTVCSPYQPLVLLLLLSLQQPVSLYCGCIS